nr:hypothetical protein [Aeromicrobium sp.]
QPPLPLCPPSPEAKHDLMCNMQGR